jgi:hypothetical protein
MYSHTGVQDSDLTPVGGGQAHGVHDGVEAGGYTSAGTLRRTCPAAAERPPATTAAGQGRGDCQLYGWRTGEQGQDPRSADWVD